MGELNKNQNNDTTVKGYQQTWNNYGEKKPL